MLLLLCNGRLMDREIGSFKTTSFVIIGLLVGPMPCIPLYTSNLYSPNE